MWWQHQTQITMEECMADKYIYCFNIYFLHKKYCVMSLITLEWLFDEISHCRYICWESFPLTRSLRKDTGSTSVVSLRTPLYTRYDIWHFFSFSPYTVVYKVQYRTYTQYNYIGQNFTELLKSRTFIISKFCNLKFAVWSYFFEVEKTNQKKMPT